MPLSVLVTVLIEIVLKCATDVLTIPESRVEVQR